MKTALYGKQDKPLASNLWEIKWVTSNASKCFQ